MKGKGEKDKKTPERGRSARGPDFLKGCCIRWAGIEKMLKRKKGGKGWESKKKQEKKGPMSRVEKAVVKGKKSVDQRITATVSTMDLPKRSQTQDRGLKRGKERRIRSEQNRTVRLTEKRISARGKGEITHPPTGVELMV